MSHSLINKNKVVIFYIIILTMSNKASVPTRTSGIDSTDVSYGIFLNSNQSSFLSTEKSTVNIPFQGNITDHDPNKVVQISLTSMLFTNTIYNITSENNQIRVLVYYAAGRGMAASQEIIEVEIPEGFYNITQLSNYLSKANVLGKEIVQQLFRYGINESFVNIFTGFGAIPQDPNDPIITKACPTNDSNTKLLFQSPDLAHMIQFGTDLGTETDNTIAHSYIYEGLYVECGLKNTLYAPLLGMMGFFNIDNAPPPLIQLSIPFGAPRYGYGMTFQAFESNPGVDAIDNTVFYTVREANLTNSSVDFASPQNFYGLVVVNNTVILTCAYQTVLTVPVPTVLVIDNGRFISGTGVSVPSPYVVGSQFANFDIQLFNGNAAFEVNNMTQGSLSIGMAIGSEYGATYLPLNATLSGLCDYRTGTIFPGFENDHCFYIIQIDPGGTTGTLNQNWTGPTATYLLAQGSNYILTSVQVNTPGALAVNMLASVNSISGIAGILTPNNVTNLSGVDEIHVHCAQLRTKNLSSVYFQSLAPADVIAVVPVEVEFGFKQNYQPPNPLVSFLNNTNISVLEMRLTDAKDRPLNFQGVDWSMTMFVSEQEAAVPASSAASGDYNTPFQDQLATMEGTAQQEIKAKRKITFLDSGYGRHRPFQGR